MGADEADALRQFLGREGHAIAGLLARTDGAGQLRLAAAYRAVLAGQRGAHEAWRRLIASLSLL